jgi:hypothetical protein
LWATCCSSNKLFFLPKLIIIVCCFQPRTVYGILWWDSLSVNYSMSDTHSSPSQPHLISYYGIWRSIVYDGFPDKL